MPHFTSRRGDKTDRLILSIYCVLTCFSATIHAADLSPPCTGKVHPAASAIGEPLAVNVWYSGEFANAWEAPACMNWQHAPFTILLAASGNFEFGGTSVTLAAKIGRISAFNTILYWSVTKQRWQPLIKHATALTSLHREATRSDFSIEELTQGSSYLFRQKENTPAGEISYQATILELSERKLRVNTFNPEPVRRLFKEWIGMGEYQSYYEFTQLDENRWHYFYALSSNAVSWLPVQKYENSYKNRAVALFRHFAGIATDLEPAQFVK